MTRLPLTLWKVTLAIKFEDTSIFSIDTLYL